MNDEQSNNPNLREKVWHNVIWPVLSNFHINPHANILDIGIKEKTFREKLIDLAPEGKMFYRDYNSTGTPVYRTLNHTSDENSLDFVIGFCVRDNFPTKLQPLLDDLERMIKPAGAVLFVLVNHSTTIQTYDEVVRTGQFPDLKREKKFYLNHGHSFDTAVKMSAFSLHANKHVKKEIELQDPHEFEVYLKKVSYIYKPVMPEELSDQVIQAQLEAFKAYCNKHHNGKYIFECDINFITLLK